jgi:hypothetical protein
MRLLCRTAINQTSPLLYRLPKHFSTQGNDQILDESNAANSDTQPHTKFDFASYDEKCEFFLKKNFSILFREENKELYTKRSELAKRKVNPENVYGGFFDGGCELHTQRVKSLDNVWVSHKDRGHQTCIFAPLLHILLDKQQGRVPKSAVSFVHGARAWKV